MGEPVRIIDLARDMIRLSGFTEDDIGIEITGLRPGEKLYEELLIGDNVSPTEHPMIMRADEEFLSWDALGRVLDELFAAVEREDFIAVRQVLQRVVSGYVPEGEIVDWYHQQRRDSQI